MEIYTHPNQIQNASSGGVISIGNFDGFHLGHKHLISEAKRHSTQANTAVFVVTFDPHPMQILRPDLEFHYLQTRQDLIENLKREGVAGLLLLNFDKKLSEFGAEQFLNEFVITPFKPTQIVVGEDFSFGKDREGDIATLKALSDKYAFKCYPVKKMEFKNQVISSSRIRKHLSEADLQEVEKLLGRKYSLSQKVVKGDGRGKSIGVPTANLDIQHNLALKVGVYVTQSEINNEIYKSVTNVGFNPTFQNEAFQSNLRVETHILENLGKDFYNEVLKVCFLSRLRDEKKFAGPKELVEQITKDKKQAALYFEAYGEMG